MRGRQSAQEGGDQALHESEPAARRISALRISRRDSGDGGLLQLKVDPHGRCSRGGEGVLS